jgi:hypothetical protein
MTFPPKLAVTLQSRAFEPKHLVALPELLQRWVAQPPLDDILIDAADYRHVMHGPGMMLIGHQCNYQIACTRTMLEISCRQKRALSPRKNPLEELFLRAREVARSIETELGGSVALEVSRARISCQDGRYRNMSVADLKEFVWLVRQTLLPLFPREPHIEISAERSPTLEVQWTWE